MELRRIRRGRDVRGGRLEAEDGSFDELSCRLARASKPARNGASGKFAGRFEASWSGLRETRRCNGTIQLLHDQQPCRSRSLFNSTGFVIETNGNVASLYKRYSILRCLVSRCCRSLSSDVPVTHKSELLSVSKGMPGEWNCFLCHSFDAAPRRHFASHGIAHAACANTRDTSGPGYWTLLRPRYT